MMEGDDTGEPVPGQVKRFDPGKGFVVPDVGGPDTLLHANVLHRSGLADLHPGKAVAIRMAAHVSAREVVLRAK